VTGNLNLNLTYIGLGLLVIGAVLAVIDYFVGDGVSVGMYIGTIIFLLGLILFPIGYVRSAFSEKA